MTSLGSLIILLAAIFFIYPLAANQTASECVAFARHSNLKAAAHLAGKSEAVGMAAHDVAVRDLPRVPAPVGCTWLYWRTVFNGTP
jgi:hypothetical protein